MLKHVKRFSLAAALILTSWSVGIAQTDYNTTLRGTWHKTYASSLAIRDGIAYITQASGYVYGGYLTTVDLHDRNRPILSKCDLAPHDIIHSIQLHGSLAYIGTAHDGVIVVDISRSQDQKKIGQCWNGPVSYYGYCVRDTLLFVTTDINPPGQFDVAGLMVFNIRNPRSPATIYGATTYLRGLRDVRIHKGYAYVACNDPSFSGMRVFDVSNPSNPKAITSIPTNSGLSLEVIDSLDVVYLADRSGGLRIIDITNPLRPFIVKSIQGSLVYSVTIVGSKAYVCTYDGLDIYDISDARNPVRLVRVPVPAEHVAVEGTLMGITTYGVPTLFYDITDLSHPQQLWSYDTWGGFANSLTVSNGYAYMPDDDGLAVARLFNPLSPNVYDPISVSRISGLGNIWNAAVAGNYIYLARTSPRSIVTVNFSNPEKPRIVGQYDGLYTFRLTVRDTLLLAVDVTNGGLKILSIADPTKPVLVGSAPMSVGGRKIVASDQYAFVIDLEQGVSIFDIRRPNMPVMVSSVSLSRPSGDPTRILGLALRGSVLFVGTNWGFFTIDVSQPEHPQILGRLENGLCGDLEVSGSYVYAAKAWGVRIIDVSGPTNPREVGQYNLPYGAGGTFDGLGLSSSLAYVAHNNQGLSVMQNASVPINLQSAPDSLQAVRHLDGEVEVTWRDRTDNEDVFLIERKAPGDIDFSSCGSTPRDMTRYIDRDVLMGFPRTYRVRAVNSFSSMTSESVYLTGILPPPRPTLISPANGAAGVPIKPKLVWGAATGATSYGIQIAMDGLFSSPFLDDPFLSTTSIEASSLKNNTTYFWRVNAKNDAGTSPWSVSRLFTTIVAVPQPPILASPADSMRNVQLNWTLSWNALTEATLYHLQLATDSDFVYIVVDDSSLASTSRPIGPLKLAMTYYWRVRAKNGAGWSDFSIFRQFSTIRTTSVEQLAGIPAEYSVSQNYPNPFNPSTRITFSIPTTSMVQLKITDALGRDVAILLACEKSAGTYSVSWNANVPSGIYFYRLQAGAYVETKKMVLLR